MKRDLCIARPDICNQPRAIQIGSQIVLLESAWVVRCLSPLFPCNSTRLERESFRRAINAIKHNKGTQLNLATLPSPFTHRFCVPIEPWTQKDPCCRSFRNSTTQQNGPQSVLHDFSDICSPPVLLFNLCSTHFRCAGRFPSLATLDALSPLALCLQSNSNSKTRWE